MKNRCFKLCKGQNSINVDHMVCLCITYLHTGMALSNTQNVQTELMHSTVCTDAYSASDAESAVH